MIARQVIALVSFAFACGACGGSAMTAAPAAQESTPASSTAAPEATQSGQHTNTMHAPDVSAARGDLDRAEQQIGAAPSDCVAACRALASMERAANHLCELDSGTECGRAKERVEAARERVHATCGGCGS